MYFYELMISELMETLEKIQKEHGDLLVVKTFWDGSTEGKHIDIEVRDECMAKNPSRYDWVMEPGDEIPKRVVID